MPGDKMDISAEVVYLGGYVIKKNTKDLGWPGDGISVSDWPQVILKCLYVAERIVISIPK